MTADTTDDIKKKYIKYKTKYLNKKYLYLEQISSTDPNPDPYLKQLAYEIVDWINMFKLVKTKYPNSKLYLKGGSTLGLHILSRTPQNMSSFKKFMAMGLIKDWDFSIIIPREYDTFVYPPNTTKCKHGLFKEFFELVTTKVSPNSGKMRVKFRSEGATICMVRHAQKLMINNDVLFESSIQIKDKIISCYMDLEIPLTSMYLELKNMSDVRDFFNMAYAFSYISQQTKGINPATDKNKINTIVNVIQKYATKQIIVPIPADHGLFKLNKPKELCYGEKYDPQLKTLFDAFECSLSEKQFILSQYFQIDRLVFRFVNKHIPKSNMIKDYFVTMGIHHNQEYWLLSERHVMDLIDKFNLYIYNALFKTAYDRLKNANDSDADETAAELFNTLDEFFGKCGIKRANDLFTLKHKDAVGNAELFRTVEKNYIKGAIRALNIFFEPIDKEYYNINVEKHLTSGNLTYVFFKYLSDFA